jgi:hypothetical protein
MKLSQVTTIVKKSTYSSFSKHSQTTSGRFILAGHRASAKSNISKYIQAF